MFMMIKLLLSLCFCYVLVSSNPLLLQSPCPICQSSYGTPIIIPQYNPNHIESITPIHFQEHINPYYENYIPPVVSPFQSTAYNQQYSDQQIYSNDVNKILFNNILNNPTLRNILDPNTMYKENGVEATSLSNAIGRSPMPNIINNYIIVPPDLVANKVKQCRSRRNNKKENDRGRCGERGRKPKCKKKKRSEVTTDTPRRKKQKQRRKSSNNEVNRKPKNSESSNQITPTKVDLNQCNDCNLGSTITFEAIAGNNYKLSNDLQSIVNEQLPFNVNNGNLDNYQYYDRVLKSYQARLNEITHSHVGDNNIFVDNTKATDSQNTCGAIGNIEAINMNDILIPQTSPYENRIPNIINDGQNELRLKINTVPNPQDELVVQEFRRKFPVIPEGVVRNLLSYVRHQYQNNQLGPNFRTSQHPASNNQSQTKQKPKRNRTNRRKKKKNKNKSNVEKDNSNTDIVEVFPIAINDTTTDSNSTEKENIPQAKPIVELPQKEYVEEVTEEKITEKYSKNDTDNSTTENISSSSVETKSIGKQDSTTSTNPTIDIYDLKYGKDIDRDIDTPDLGEEDTVSEYPNSLDDYYPDFRADNHAYLLGDDGYVNENIRDDKNYYTTDKTVDTMINRERSKYDRSYNNNNLKNSLKPLRRPYKNQYDEDHDEEIEDTLPKPELKINEENKFIEVEFRTPPALEVPDFETKMIDKTSAFTESTYPEVYLNKNMNENGKSSTYPESNLEQNKKQVPKVDKIETVYARSKVRKYGQNGDPKDKSVEIESVDRNSAEDRDTKDRKIKTDGPSVVYAQSIPQ